MVYFFGLIDRILYAIVGLVLCLVVLVTIPMYIFIGFLWDLKLHTNIFDDIGVKEIFTRDLPDALMLKHRFSEFIKELDKPDIEN